MFEPLPDGLRKLLMPRPITNPDLIVVRVRDADQPYGTGTSIKFTSDEDGMTAIDKIANWICSAWESEDICKK